MSASSPSPSAVLPPSAAPAPRSGLDNNPSGSQPSPRPERGEFSVTFRGERDFEAHEAACLFLKARGFSVGEMERHNPIGAVLGEAMIGKWSKLDAEERAEIQVVLLADDFRNGPVKALLDQRAPSTARIAFELTEEDLIDMAARHEVEAQP